MKKEKFDWNLWAQLMQNANKSGNKYTTILGIKYSSGRLLAKEFIPFTTSVGPLTGVEFESAIPTVTTAARIESTILRAFSKTNYDALENKSNISLGRYVIAPAKMPLHILQKTFDYIFENKSKRISKSWLKPLQDLILSKQVNLEKRKVALGKELDEPAESHDMDDLDNLENIRTPKRGRLEKESQWNILRKKYGDTTSKPRPIPKQSGAIVGNTTTNVRLQDDYTFGNLFYFEGKMLNATEYYQAMLKKQEEMRKPRDLKSNYLNYITYGTAGAKLASKERIRTEDFVDPIDGTRKTRIVPNKNTPTDINAGSKEEWKA